MIARKYSFIPTVLAVGTAILSAHAQQFNQVNLVTDDQGANPAKITDPNLVNPWGVSFSPAGSPFWVSDNGQGVSTLYNVTPATDVPSIVGLVVTIPGDGSATGQTFNGGSDFNSDRFLFVGEDGTISGWRGGLGTSAETLQTASPNNIYKGTTLDVTGGNSYLLSPNFKSGAIDVMKGAGAPALPGNFTDPNLPAGYAPFNIRVLGTKIYVTYAQQNGKDDLPGPGHGFVSEFDLQGNFLTRIGAMGTLNSPWGLEIAPPSFGVYANDLLVGNFGDGTINAFDPNGGGFLGQLPAVGGATLAIPGLWALTVGNDGSGGSSDKLYFTAGPDDESHGLFGVLEAVPEGGSSVILLTMGLAILSLIRLNRPTQRFPEI